MGKPEETRVEAEMSDGQLLMRVRALVREEAWAPPYVARDLSGATQAVTVWQDKADTLAFRAEHADDPAERAQLEAEAAAAATRVGELQAQVAELETTDTARAKWYVETAVTRDLGERARAELARRGIDPDSRAHEVTAEDLLAAWRQDQAETEAHQPITEADLAQDNTADRDWIAADTEPDVVAETAVPDIREVAAVEQPFEPNVEYWDRVPEADTTREAVELAHRSLTEMRQRHEWEEAREQEARATQPTVWDAADQVRADSATHDPQLVRE